MRCNFWILIVVLFSKWNGFSQEKHIQHVVAKGETIYKIAQQYNLKPAVLYEANPEAVNGIKAEQLLLIPFATVKIGNSSRSKVAESKTQAHIVVVKETLYGIAKHYGLKVADLYRVNPSLEKKALRVGDTILIPVTESTDLAVENSPKIETSKVANKTLEQDKQNAVAAITTEENKETTVLDADGNQIKEVLAKETLYGIAKSYGVSLSDLEKANPILATQPLRIGQKIVIPNNKRQALLPTAAVVPTEEELKTVVSDSETSPAIVSSETEKEFEVEFVREVLAKETKYGIAKEYGLTVKELEAQNPKIVNRLLVGEKLNIRTLKSKVPPTSKDVFADTNLKNSEGNADETVYKVNSFHKDDFVAQLISTAAENIGVRYRSGGTTKDGFDCSGLMCTTFGAFDIQLPRTSFEQAQYGMKIEAEQAQKGDLIFFRTNGRSRINHVGMVVEVAPDGEIKFIHASVSNGVIISSIKEKYYSKRVTQINRVL